MVVIKSLVYKPPEGFDAQNCWLCGGHKRVEWSGVDGFDENGEPVIVEGVYDPCPECMVSIE